MRVRLGLLRILATAPLRGPGLDTLRTLGDVDVGRVAAGRADGDEREVEHRPAAAVGLGDDDVGADLGDAGGEVVGAEEAHRAGRAGDPRLLHDLAEGAQRVEAGAAQRRGGEDLQGREV